MPNPNRAVIDEFRANAGRVGGPFTGADLLLLTAGGVTSPLGYHDEGDRLLVYASNAGRDRDPRWYRRLLDDPVGTVEVGTERYRAVGAALHGAERDRCYREQGERVPAYAEYQRGTGRPIPVVALYRMDHSDRGLAVAVQLVHAHTALRAQLAEVAASTAAAAGADTAASGNSAAGDDIAASTSTDTGTAGSEHAAAGGAASTVGASGGDVFGHCLAWCAEVGEHHRNEDATFPRLLDALPGLAGTVRRLRAEHRTVAEGLRELDRLVAAGDATAVTAARTALGARLDDHFGAEERALLPALDTLPDTW
ncbi:nitroreductase/quinone reductase family protein [Actinocatenispora thailandica]|uniref:nitroreductase/quinone reductase family protein n=1 Tax=Actinocatenispora thailandica TaxID=227318 RepID=UPI0031DF9ED8